MKLLLNIIVGYSLLVKDLIKGHITWQALQRIRVCNTCPYRKEDSNWCMACHCFLPAKIRAPKAHCPKGYWHIARIDRPRRGWEAGD